MITWSRDATESELVATVRTLARLPLLASIFADFQLRFFRNRPVFNGPAFKRACSGDQPPFRSPGIPVNLSSYS